MPSSLIRRLAGLGAALALAAAAATGAAATAGAADQPLKVGFVYVGPVGDYGWSYQHDQGRKELETALAGKVSTAYVENVPEGADAERVITQFAQQGFGLVFTTSFGFMNPTLKVAKKFPNVKFEHSTGYKRDANLATYAARFYEGRTVLGTIAGRVTKSNIIGYIASFPIPEVVQGINAFTIALRQVNPEAQVKVVWVNSWYDPGKERQAAETLIAQGADVLTQHTDSPAPVQVAEEKGVYAFGQSSDMSAFGPRAHLASIVDEWGAYYIARAEAVLAGTWEATDTWGGLDSGMVRVTEVNSALPEAVRAEAAAVLADLASGKRHAFAGPIRNQAGAVVVPEGQTIPDDKILSMDWYVEGVQGSLPK